MYRRGAAVVGIVSAAGAFLIEHFRQDRRRHAFTQDLDRMNNQLANLREELEYVRNLQNERSKLRRSGNSKRVSSNSTTSLSSTSTNYKSAQDSDSDSDLQFYDLSNDEGSDSETTDLQKVLSDIDVILATEEEFEEPLQKLEVLNKRYPENGEISWRLGKALKVKATLTKDDEFRKEIIQTGIEVCTKATEMHPNSAECHKWMAILVGMRSEQQPLKERILDGHLFKNHVEKALEITPNDADLHHLLGRYIFEVAKLSWLERNVAKTLFAELPSCTYQDALDRFMAAERLSTDREWKENLLFIAKCHIGNNDIDQAVQWLFKADSVNSIEDDKVDEEVTTLLKKHKGS